MEIQSGLFATRPTVFGALHRARSGSTAAILMHPTSNFHNHYLLKPLSELGITTLALNSRYVNNDATLIMERVLLDLAAGVTYLRQQGFDNVTLLGNSGGGALMATYQAEAERRQAESTETGDLLLNSIHELPVADGIGLIAAHPGRARFLTRCLDAAVINENDVEQLDTNWDIFNPRHGPPFTVDFVEGIEKRQRDRNHRITDFARKRLNKLRQSDGPATDEVFIIRRTAADPRFVDLSLDANDRSAGTIWGDAETINAAANGPARVTTCTSFLSQWSLEETGADGPENLLNTSVPVMIMEYTADAAVFPSDTVAWLKCCKGRSTYHAIQGATHYLTQQPEKISEVTNLTAEWIQATEKR
jgi:pimeloyl-ACP methyl ester carboxylesterase